MPVKFFWERWHRATQMDMSNKLNGRHTHYWIEAEEWLEAYKKTLSKSQLDKFNKEWNKLEQDSSNFISGKKGSKPTCW